MQVSGRKSSDGYSSKSIDDNETHEDTEDGKDEGETNNIIE